MKLQNAISAVALRTTVRLAWGMARAAQALEAVGGRIECAADRQATRWAVDITEALEPLTRPVRAS
jgi:hypothetical protein